MLAYHGDPKVKEKYLGQMKAHRAADEIIQGRYWEDGKGCAVGCLTHNGYGNHAAYEDLIGVPRLLARLEDRIFEGLSVEDSKEWPVRFLSAINVGADLTLVWPKFALWLIADPEDGVLKYIKDERVRAKVEWIAELFRRQIAGEFVEAKVFWDAREELYVTRRADAYAYAAAAAAAAADAATAAAYATAAAATDAYATDATATATAAYATDAAATAAAAADAAATATAAYATDAAATAARQSWYLKASNKLEGILRETK